MSLTAAQRLSVFEILGVPSVPSSGTHANELLLHNGFTITLNLEEMGTLRQAVDDVLGGLAADTETRVITYITEWDALGLNVGTLEGGVDDIQGLSWSYEAKRELITTRMHYFVPVVDMARAVKKREQSTNGGGTVRIIR